MDLGFHGETVEYYHRCRHGYPEAVISKLAGLFGLDDRDVVVDLGADTDLPVLRRVLGEESVAVVTIAQALHWMQAPELFRAAAPLSRPGGGVAVVTNGTPLWRQDTGWSRALRGFLTRWLGHEVSSACGTDEQSQQRYRRELAAAGYDVVGEAVDYEAGLDLDQVIGGAGRFTEGAGRFTEQVYVAILAGRLR